MAADYRFLRTTVSFPRRLIVGATGTRPPPPTSPPGLLQSAPLPRPSQVPLAPQSVRPVSAHFSACVRAFFGACVRAFFVMEIEDEGGGEAAPGRWRVPDDCAAAQWGLWTAALLLPKLTWGKKEGQKRLVADTATPAFCCSWSGAGASAIRCRGLRMWYALPPLIQVS